MPNFFRISNNTKQLLPADVEPLLVELGIVNYDKNSWHLRPGEKNMINKPLVPRDRVILPLYI